MTDKLILYSTSGCHLCDMAADLLNQNGVSFVTEDIAFNDALFSLYGTRIPVIKRMDTQTELGWPFESQHITEFLS